MPPKSVNFNLITLRCLWELLVVKYWYFFPKQGIGAGGTGRILTWDDRPPRRCWAAQDSNPANCTRPKMILSRIHLSGHRELCQACYLDWRYRAYPHSNGARQPRILIQSTVPSPNWSLVDHICPAIEDCAKNVTSNKNMRGESLTEFGRDGKKPRPVGTWSNNWGRGWAEDIDPIPCLVPSPVPTLIMDSPPSLVWKALESLLHIGDGKKTHPVGTWSNNWGQGWGEDIFAIPWLVPSPVPTLIMDSWSWEPLKAYYILRDDKKYPFDGNRE